MANPAPMAILSVQKQALPMTKIIDKSFSWSKLYNEIFTCVFALLVLTNIVVYVRMRHNDRQEA